MYIDDTFCSFFHVDEETGWYDGQVNSLVLSVPYAISEISYAITYALLICPAEMEIHNLFRLISIQMILNSII